MTQEQFEREARYRAAMVIAVRMLRQGLISAREYRQIDTMCMAKYLPVIGSFLPAKP